MVNKHVQVIINKFSKAGVKAWVPPGSVLDPLFFAIFINDPSDNLISNPKLFADGLSLDNVLKYYFISIKRKDDIGKVQKCAFQKKKKKNDS